MGPRRVSNPPATNLPVPAEPKDPIPWAVEHEAHRHAPGNWTSGGPHAVLRADRSDRYRLLLGFGPFITLGAGDFAVDRPY